jgi:ATP-dependent helicase/DNAse subunit B
VLDKCESENASNKVLEIGYNLTKGKSEMPEYSISQLDKFEECALQYKFLYVDKIKRYEEGVEAFLGQRFHDAMEWLYKERAFRIVPLEEILEYYEKDWAKQCMPKSAIP